MRFFSREGEHMKLKSLFLMLLTFIFVTQAAFSASIKKKDAEPAWKEFYDRYELAVKKGSLELAPREAMIVKGLMEEIQKDLKEEEWEDAFQKSKIGFSYLLLIQSINEFKEAEKSYEEIRQK